jgi:CHAT domain
LKSVVDGVISSYTPTFQDSADLKALLIGMPKTPGLPSGDLPFVETELQSIREQLQKLPDIKATTLIKNPNKAQVLEALSTHQVIHSCHGSSAGDPSKSRLLVDDCETLPLTVADITVLKIKHGQFAYLSA